LRSVHGVADPVRDHNAFALARLLDRLFLFPSSSGIFGWSMNQTSTLGSLRSSRLASGS
jgi:hypothetical protein